MPALAVDSRNQALEEHVLYVFDVRAVRDPQALSRVTGLFAQRNIIPDYVQCQRSDDFLLVEVGVKLKTPADADLLLEKLRSMVLIDRANLIDRER